MKRYIKLGIILINLITYNALGQKKNILESPVNFTKAILEGESMLEKSPDQALSISKRLIDSLKTNKSSVAYIRALYLRGCANSNLENYKIALKDFFECQNHSYFIHDTSVLAELRFKIGRCYDCISDVNNATTYYHEALDLYLSKNNLYGQAKVLQNIGIMESDRRRDSLAMAYYQKALGIYQLLGDKSKQADIVLNIGVIYSNQENYDKTIEYYTKALKIFSSENDMEGMATVENNLGLAYEGKLLFNKALSHYNKALQSFRILKSRSGLAYVYDNLGSLYGRLKKADLAIQYYKTGLQYADSVQEMDFQAYISKEIADLYEKSGNYDQALFYFKKGSLLQDSLSNSENKKKLAEADAQFQDKLKDIEIQKKEFQLHAQQKQKMFYLAGITILSLMVFVLIWAYRRKTIAENQIKRHREILEDEIQLRTQELKAEMFERKAAEEADKLKTAFLANMSHEIRTPMNAILSFSNFLKDPEISAAQRNEYANYINSCSISLLHLIDDILDTARIEARQLKINPNPFSVNSMLNELYVYFQNHKKCQEGDIRINVKTSCISRNYTIKTDGIRLRQIFTNLIDNAFKFTDRGNIQFGFEQEDDLLKFYVSDTGLGIPPDKKNVIFERFGQVQDNSQKIYKGTGLGLSISKNLVELLGGKMWVESKVNEGSTFYFTLPATDLEITDLLQAMPERINSPNTHRDWKEIKILVAEDDALNFKLINIALAKTHATILHAINGEDVLKIARLNPDIKLILMDIQMPVLDGYETTRRIKKEFPDMIVIAQTAFAMSDDKEKCLNAGCNDYISKPIDFDEMYRKLGYYLTLTKTNI